MWVQVRVYAASVDCSSSHTSPGTTSTPTLGHWLFFQNNRRGGGKYQGWEQNARQILHHRATPENKTAQNSLYNNGVFTLNSTSFWYMPLGLQPLSTTLSKHFPGKTSRWLVFFIFFCATCSQNLFWHRQSKNEKRTILQLLTNKNGKRFVENWSSHIALAKSILFDINLLWSICDQREDVINMKITSGLSSPPSCPFFLHLGGKGGFRKGWTGWLAISHFGKAR